MAHMGILSIFGLPYFFVTLFYFLNGDPEQGHVQKYVGMCMCVCIYIYIVYLGTYVYMCVYIHMYT